MPETQPISWRSIVYGTPVTSSDGYPRTLDVVQRGSQKSFSSVTALCNRLRSSRRSCNVPDADAVWLRRREAIWIKSPILPIALSRAPMARSPRGSVSTLFGAFGAKDFNISTA